MADIVEFPPGCIDSSGPIMNWGQCDGRPQRIVYTWRQGVPDSVTISEGISSESGRDWCCSLGCQAHVYPVTVPAQEQLAYWPV